MERASGTARARCRTVEHCDKETLCCGLAVRKTRENEGRVLEVALPGFWAWADCPECGAEAWGLHFRVTTPGVPFGLVSAGHVDLDEGPPASRS